MVDVNANLKKLLRQKMIIKRNALSSQEVAESSEKIIKNLIAFLEKQNLPKKTVLATYWPINNEVDVRLIFDWLWESGHIICLPKISGNQLQFIKWNENDKLTKNKNVFEPQSINIIDPAVYIIPLVAFDENNNRIGYGMGFYDRALGDKNTLKIGLGHRFQAVKKIATSPHDIPLDAIITGSINI